MRRPLPPGAPTDTSGLLGLCAPSPASWLVPPLLTGHARGGPAAQSLQSHRRVTGGPAPTASLEANSWARPQAGGSGHSRDLNAPAGPWRAGSMSGSPGRKALPPAGRGRILNSPPPSGGLCLNLPRGGPGHGKPGHVRTNTNPASASGLPGLPAPRPPGATAASALGAAAGTSRNAPLGAAGVWAAPLFRHAPPRSQVTSPGQRGAGARQQVPQPRLLLGRSCGGHRLVRALPAPPCAQGPRDGVHPPRPPGWSGRRGAPSAPRAPAGR